MYLYFYYVYWTENYVKQSFCLYKIARQMFLFNIIINSKGSCHSTLRRKKLESHPFQRDVHRLYFSLSGIQLSIKSLCPSIHWRTALVSVPRVSSMPRIRELISLSERWIFPKRAAANGCSLLNPFLAIEWICSASP